MSVLLWFVAAGAAGWIACSLADLNAARGFAIAGLIGTVGVLFGSAPAGVVFAPVDGLATLHSPFAVLLGSVLALGGLRVGRAVCGYFRNPVVAPPLAEERP